MKDKPIITSIWYQWNKVNLRVPASIARRLKLSRASGKKMSFKWEEKNVPVPGVFSKHGMPRFYTFFMLTPVRRRRRGN